MDTLERIIVLMASGFCRKRTVSFVLLCFGHGWWVSGALGLMKVFDRRELKAVFDVDAATTHINVL